MRKLDQLGGGVVFEAMRPSDIDAFMADCADRAAADLKKQQSISGFGRSTQAIATDPNI
ncbi:hypothetical protein ABIB99_008896 [Bradyrhizobium sp. LA6.1]|uniref:hypothetical protein n=1 Tax=Bradyrhizobium sp. LA6.1 TaxID=3156378 RepID=UPI00339B4050